MKILVVDDDFATREGLARIFRHEGYQVVLAGDGTTAIALFEKEKPDLICLDVMMPGKDGYQVCRQIRGKDELIPILFISAKGEEIDKVVGMELGADDFIVKPFGVREVIARVRAVTRRCLLARKILETDQHRREGQTSFKMGDLEVFPLELRAKRGTECIDLSIREIQILQLFFDHPGEVLNRVFIAERCWGYEILPVSRTIDQHISQLRKKIEANPETPVILHTVRGAGYRFDEFL